MAWGVSWPPCFCPERRSIVASGQICGRRRSGPCWLMSQSFLVRVLGQTVAVPLAAKPGSFPDACGDGEGSCCPGNPG